MYFWLLFKSYCFTTNSVHETTERFIYSFLLLQSMDRESLKRIGLADEEINIYILLLRKGASKATTISKDLGVARTTTYRFLASLQEKGLVSENIQNNLRWWRR